MKFVRKQCKAAVALLLILSMVTGLVPPDVFRHAIARAEAALQEAPSVWEEAADYGPEQTSDGWRYVVNEEKNTALVTGYEGAGTAEMTVPDLLDGADTVAIAAEALRHLSALDTLTVPGNVRQIGSRALPAGVTVCATNASYAQEWAAANGHPFASVSEYDFRDGVVDFTGIRGGNFVRVSENEVQLRALEAERLRAGTLFYLLDPANPYQISYYRAEELTPMDNGFVSVRCSTPDVDAMVNYICLTNEPLVVDMSTVVASEYAEILPYEQVRGVESSASEELKFGISVNKLPVTQDFKLTVSGSVSSSFVGDFEAGLFKGKKAKVTQTDKISLDAQLFTEAEAFEESLGSMDDSIKNVRDKLISQHRTKDSYRSAKEKVFGKSITVGRAMVFSVAGWVTLTASIRLTAEFKGTLEVSFSSTTETTYTYENGKVNKSSKTKKNTLTASVEAEFKFGITAEMSLYITILKVMKLELFLGLKATAEWDAFASSGMSLTDMTDFLSAALSRDYLGIFMFPRYVNGNMLDCIHVEVYLVAEIEIALMAQVEVPTASGTVPVGADGPKLTYTLLKLPLLDFHLHLAGNHYELQGIYESNVGKEYTYQAKEGKDNLHKTENCPYDTKEIRFLYPFSTEPALEMVGVTIGTQIEAPDVLNTVRRLYRRKFVAWHTDSSLDEASKVQEWPYTVKDDQDFYAETYPLHNVRLIRVDGRRIDPSTATVVNNTAEMDEEMYYTLKDDERVAEGDHINLPDCTYGAGNVPITGWMVVKGPTNTTSYFGDNVVYGRQFEVTSRMPDTIYLCAITEQDARLVYNTLIAGESFEEYVPSGQEITLSTNTPNPPRFRFVGWRDENNNIVSTVTTQPGKHSYYFEAVWEETGKITAKELDSCDLGEALSFTNQTPAPDDLIYYKHFEGTDSEGTDQYYISIGGLREPEKWSRVNIPDFIDGWPVKRILAGAFKDNAHLLSITLPGSVSVLGSETFSGCTALEAIDLSRTTAAAFPEKFAYGCTALRCVYVPKTVEAIKTSAFANCRSLTRANIDADIWDNAFDGCVSLSAVKLGSRVDAIGMCAFRYCNITGKLEIPDSVQQLESSFILGNIGITELTIPGSVKTISKEAMAIGPGSLLEKVNLEYGTTSLGIECFANAGYGFPHLTSITLPASVGILREDILRGSAITDLTLHMSRKFILNPYSLRGCDQLKNVTITGGEIGASSFAELEALENVTIGSQVTYIGDRAFYGCTNLKTVTFEEGSMLEKIGDRAFCGCENLKTLHFPDSVTKYGSGMLQGCTSLEELYVGGSGIILSAGSTSGTAITNPFYIGPGSLLRELIIGEGITSIGAYVFSNCANAGGYNPAKADAGFPLLEVMDLPSTLGNIGAFAFSGVGLRDLVVSAGVRLSSSAFASASIENLILEDFAGESHAFANNTELTSVVIRSGSIPDYCFSGCTNLKNVVLMEGVTSIGSYAFQNCTGLTRLSIPDSVTSIAAGTAVMGCVNLEYLKLPKSILSYSFLEQYSSYSPYYIGSGSKLKTLVIPEGVTTIGQYAFTNRRKSGGNTYAYGYPELTEVILPSTISRIGTHAFSGSKLHMLELGEVTVDSYAFSGMTSLKSVSIAGGTIGQHAFENCTGLNQLMLGDGVTAIEYGAFLNCTGLTSLSIPDSVTSLAATSFIEGCKNLEYLRISAGVASYAYKDSNSARSPYYIGSGSKLKTLVIPEGVTSLGNRAFSNCGKNYPHFFSLGYPELTTVELPSTLTYLGSHVFDGSQIHTLDLGTVTVDSYAFSGMESLKTVSIAGGTIGTNAFENCTGLSQLTLGEGVTAIEHGAFLNCTGLTSLSIPDSVTSLAATSFIEGCKNLEYLRVSAGFTSYAYVESSFSHSPYYIGSGSKLKTLVIPEGVTSLGESAFANCKKDYPSFYSYGYPNLTTVVLPSTLTYLGRHVFDGSQIHTLDLGTVTLDSYAFSGMESLKTVSIAGGTVGRSAFENCTGLAQLTLGDGVTAIEHEAFLNCTGLTSLSIPDSVTSLAATSFIEGCKNLEYLRIPASITSYSYKDENGSYSPFYIGAGSKLKTLVIPEGVTSLGYRAFSNCKETGNSFTGYGYPSLTTVVLPSTLTHLGGYVFRGSQVHTLHLGQVTLDSYAFADLKTLKTVSIAGGTIGRSAFENCTGLSQLTLGDGVTSIDTYAFNNCKNLRSLSIPDSVTSLAATNFIEGCTGLEYLRIPASIRSYSYTMTNGAKTPYYIGSGSKLKTLVIPEGVTSIGQYAFSNAQKTYNSFTAPGYPYLTTLILPSTLTALEMNNLNYWPALQWLHAGENLQTLGYSGKPAGLTLVSDTYSEKLASLASSVNMAYTAGNPEALPAFAFRRFVPQAALAARALAVSDGAYVATRGTEGETAVVPEGWALTEETSLRLRETVAAGDPALSESAVFLGWYTDPELTQPWLMSSMPAADLTLYAKVHLPVTARFAVPQEVAGAADDALEEGWLLYHRQTLLPSETILAPEAVPEREGWEFTGWYVNPETTEPWKLTAAPETDKTLYAGFRKCVTVTFALRNAAGAADASLPAGFTVYRQLVLPAGSAFSVPADPVREGYSFHGWYADPGLEFAYTPVRVEGDLVFYGEMQRVSAGAKYERVTDGLRLASYRTQENESTQVRLPSQVGGVPVVEIGSHAFHGSEIESVYLPDTVLRVAQDAFDDSLVKTILVSGANPVYSAVDGVLMSRDRTLLYCYPAARTNRTYAMPDTIRAVMPHAFEGSSLTQVTFSGALEEIGEKAFADCAALASVSLPDSCTTIRLNAFENCWALQQFTAHGLTLIEGTDKQSTIPRGTGMRVYGPAVSGALHEWFEGTYQYNQYLISLYVNGTLYETIGAEAGVLLPDDLRDPLVTDDDIISAWYRDEAMTEMWDLARDVMPAEDIRLYGSQMPLFTGEACEWTTADGETLSGMMLTAYNRTSPEVIVPETWSGSTVIALGAEFLKASPVTVSAVTIGDNVQSIAETALLDAEGSFAGAVVTDSGTCAEQFAVKQGYPVKYLQYTLRFANTGSPVKSKTAAKGVEVKLPVPEKPGLSFAGWYTDEMLTQAAPLDEDNLFIMPGMDTVLYAAWEGMEEQVPFTWTWNSKGVTITGYTGTEVEAAVPASINGLPVIAIGAEAFADCSALRSISLPEGVVTIGERAFFGCTAIAGIVLPNSVTAVGESAFFGCTALKRVAIGTGLAAVEADLFHGCARLETVTAAEGHPSLKTLDGVLFTADGSMLLVYPEGLAQESYTIPDGVTMIARGAFSGNEALCTITVPAGLLDVAEEAFRGCSALEAFVGADVETIGEKAFFGCTSLAAFDGGDGLLLVGDFAFSGCNALKTVHWPESLQMKADAPVFGRTSGLIITGTINTSAHAYAQANGMAFHDPDALAVTAVSLPERVDLLLGETMQVQASLTPAEAELGAEISWWMADESVAIVSADGVVSGLGGGQTTLYARTGNGLTASCPVIVRVFPEAVSFSEAALLLEPGGSCALAPIIAPENTTERELQWRSSDESVATVDATGLILAQNPGETVITAETVNGLKAEISVTVAILATEVNISLGSTQGKALFAGVEGLAALQAEALLTPADATCTGLAWKSSNPAVLAVDETGLLSAHAPGSATITLTAQTLPKALVCSVTLTVQSVERRMQLPSALRTIADESFAGNTAMQWVTIPDGAVSIGSRAFAGATGLRLIDIPSTVESIAQDAFEGVEQLVIRCEEGSHAHEWALEKGFLCVAE